MPNVRKLISNTIAGKDKTYHSYLVEDGEDFYCVMYMNNFIVSVRKNHSEIKDLKAPEHILKLVKDFIIDNPYEK